MSGPTAPRVGPSNMTTRHPTARVGEIPYTADELARENDPRLLIRATQSLVDGMGRFLNSREDWRETVANGSQRRLVWEQVLFAHEVLDRLMAVMLTELDHGTWREENTDERVLPL